jgi:ankyrin repeat protein
MKLLANMDVLDEMIMKEIKLKNSNQKKLVDLIKFHLKNGFLLKHNGNMHLQAACRLKKNNIVDFLIQAGADVNFRDSHGESAISFAILKFGCHLRSEGPHVCALVDKLVRQRALLSMQDNLGRSVLHKWAFDDRYIFAEHGYNQMILERLLQENASVDLVDTEGNNVLMYAALHSTSRFMMLLDTIMKPPPLRRNFILDQQNFAGETCAHLLAVRNHDRRINCNGGDDNEDGDAFKMLISKGVSLYIKNTAGETVIDCIIDSRYGFDYNRKVIYKHTHECMLAFLMGTHSRLGSQSHVNHMHDIALDLVLREIRNQLESIALSMHCTDYVC